MASAEGIFSEPFNSSVNVSRSAVKRMISETETFKCCFDLSDTFPICVPFVRGRENFDADQRSSNQLVLLSCIRDQIASSLFPNSGASSSH